MEKPHILFFPFPVLGHINPMLLFAQSIVKAYCVRATFLTTQYRLEQLKKSCGKEDDDEAFCFMGIPDDISDEDRDGPLAAIRTFQAVGMMAGTGIFDKVLEDLEAKGRPVTCVISDTFLSWTQFAADRKGIERVSFWTSCASSYLIHNRTSALIEQGFLPIKATPANAERVPFCKLLGTDEPLPLESLPSVMHVQDINEERFSSLLGIFENDNKCKYLLVNTLEALEPKQLQVLKSVGVPVLAIGPLLPPSLLTRTPLSSLDGVERISLVEENRKCLDWLDLNPSNSILYISFGSIAALSKEEMQDLAKGLEESGVRFLWVVRASSDGGVDEEGTMPDGFMKRTDGRGMVISWAPQLAVLAHAAVGGFLTHAGWNSTLEAIACGIPMIASPTDFGEQRTVAWLIEKVWGIGLQLELCPTGNSSGNRVAQAIGQLMNSVEAATFRRNAARLREASMEAVVAPNGSSYKELSVLAEEVFGKK